MNKTYVEILSHVDRKESHKGVHLAPQGHLQMQGVCSICLQHQVGSYTTRQDKTNSGDEPRVALACEPMWLIPLHLHSPSS